MIMTRTTSRPNAEQRSRIEAFLSDFLARLERDQPGVLAAYHYHDEETGESTTLIVWRDGASREAYRESALIREAMAMEQALGLTSSRSTVALTYPSHG
jgi:heme-degrading monooxygenase HmoA